MTVLKVNKQLWNPYCTGFLFSTYLFSLQLLIADFRLGLLSLPLDAHFTSYYNRAGLVHVAQLPAPNDASTPLSNLFSSSLWTHLNTSALSLKPLPIITGFLRSWFSLVKALVCKSKVECPFSFLNSVTDSVSTSPGTTTEGEHCKAQRGKCSKHRFDEQRCCFFFLQSNTWGDVMFVSEGEREIGREVKYQREKWVISRSNNKNAAKRYCFQVYGTLFIFLTPPW